MKRLAKYVCIIVLFLLPLMLFAQKQDKIVMPEFPGGVKKLHDFLLKETKYPIEARTNGEIGEVVVAFSVEPNGEITSVRVIKSVSKSLDNEAVRVVRSMPKWNPGKRNGRKTRADLSLPINFRIIYDNDIYVDDEVDESRGGVLKESARDKRNKRAGVKKL